MAQGLLGSSLLLAAHATPHAGQLGMQQPPVTRPLPACRAVAACAAELPGIGRAVGAYQAVPWAWGCPQVSREPASLDTRLGVLLHLGALTPSSPYLPCPRKGLRRKPRRPSPLGMCLRVLAQRDRVLSSSSLKQAEPPSALLFPRLVRPTGFALSSPAHCLCSHRTCLCLCPSAFCLLCAPGPSPPCRLPVLCSAPQCRVMSPGRASTQHTLG